MLALADKLTFADLKINMATSKKKTGGFKMVVHKPVGDFKTAT